MRYVLLLRGINVGGKNKVNMSDFKSQLAELGFEEISSYINSGNFFFNSHCPESQIKDNLDSFLQKHYAFVTSYCLLNSRAFKEDKDNLPSWWQEDLARKDVLFYTREGQNKLAEEIVNQMTLSDEVVHFGEYAMFWGKYNEKQFLKTAYHTQLMKTAIYKKITIRNSKTYDKIDFELTK